MTHVTRFLIGLAVAQGFSLHAQTVMFMDASSTTAAAGGGGGPTAFFSHDFETGTDVSDGTSGTPEFNVAGVFGNYSLRINANGELAEFLHDETNAFTAYFVFKPTTIPSATEYFYTWYEVTAGPTYTIKGSLRIKSTGIVNVWHGTTELNLPGALVVNTTNAIRLEYASGSAGDGFIRVEASTDGTFDGAGNVIQSTVGTSTGVVESQVFEKVGNNGGVYQFDDFVVYPGTNAISADPFSRTWP